MDTCCSALERRPTPAARSQRSGLSSGEPRQWGGARRTMHGLPGSGPRPGGAARGGGGGGCGQPPEGGDERQFDEVAHDAEGDAAQFVWGGVHGAVPIAGSVGRGGTQRGVRACGVYEDLGGDGHRGVQGRGSALQQGKSKWGVRPRHGGKRCRVHPCWAARMVTTRVRVRCGRPKPRTSISLPRALHNQAPLGGRLAESPQCILRVFAALQVVAERRTGDFAAEERWRGLG